MPHPPLIHLVGGARPNFVKLAPLFRALVAVDWCRVSLVHTGQHYDWTMSDGLLLDLGLPSPHVSLGVGSGTHAQQTAGIMVAYEQVCLASSPDWVVVVGDVNSTLACALVAAKLQVPVAHLEAGLRSFDRSMPEEINRVLVDALANLLWTPSPDADDNLLRAGISADRIHRVGNIMLDSYELLRPRIDAQHTAAGLGLARREYGVVTLHRPTNVDDAHTLGGLVQTLGALARSRPLVFPLHPLTRRRLEQFGLLDTLERTPGLVVMDALGYVAFMSLVQDAGFVITDSGCVQEETTYLGIPCLTLRDTTERPITVLEGTNSLVRLEDLEERVGRLPRGHLPPARRPHLWDGQTARRVVTSLQLQLQPST